jgi:type IV pilus assembly protein PilB
MILVTGPTGSGKTVSLYTCLNILNQPGVNIATVEDPAEINLPGINQVNVNDRPG